MRSGRTRQVVVVLGALALLLAGSVLVSPPAVGQDGAGLRIEAATDYLVIPEENRVAVTVTMTATNEIPDDPDGRYYFFTDFRTVTPVGIENLAAVSEGVELTADVLDTSVDRQLVHVDLHRDLLYGQVNTTTLTYDIVNGAPRSSQPARVNPSYLSFPIWVFGDPGLGSVTVRVPEEFDVVLEYGRLDQRLENGYIVLEANAIEVSRDFYEVVVGRNDAGLAETELETPAGHDFLVRAWPDDAGWADLVGEVLADQLPELEALIGQPWPLEDRLELVEAVMPYTHGPEGWRFANDSTIEVSHLVIEEVILHELAHAWLNEGLFVERWISEGLASELASQVAGGGGFLDLPDPEEISTLAHGAQPLVEWTSPPHGADPELYGGRESYGHEASWWVVRSLAEEVGNEGIAAVIAAAHDGEPAYVEAAAAGAEPGTNDWRRLLDLLEQTAGSTEAEALFRKYVVSEGDLAELDNRAEARAAYAELKAADDDLAVPAGVALAMESWDFAAATAQVESAHAVVEYRNAVSERAAELGVEAPLLIAESYAASTGDFDPAIAVLDDQTAALDAIERAADAAAADPDLWERAELRDTHLDSHLDRARANFEAGDNQAARTAVAEMMDALVVAGTKGQGLSSGAVAGIAGAAAGAAVVLALVGFLLVRRRRRA